MNDLTYRGIGIGTKQADVFSESEEIFMWQHGILGNSSSEILQYTLYFYNCKLFGLRGREEHHDLKVNDFVLGYDCEGTQYIEYTSRSRKNFNGGLKQKHFEPKIIRHYETEGKMSVIPLYKEYFEALGKNDGPFYLRTLLNIMNSLQFGKQRVGVNTLSKIMPILAERARLKGNYTSHSGKATCATRLSEYCIDDKVIKKRLANRSSKGLEVYKRRRDDDYNSSHALNPPAICSSVNPTLVPTSAEDLPQSFFKDIMECGPPQQSTTETQDQSVTLQTGQTSLYNCNFYIYRS